MKINTVKKKKNRKIMVAHWRAPPPRLKKKKKKKKNGAGKVGAASVTRRMPSMKSALRKDKVIAVTTKVWNLIREKRLGGATDSKTNTHRWRRQRYKTEMPPREKLLILEEGKLQPTRSQRRAMSWQHPAPRPDIKLSLKQHTETHTALSCAKSLVTGSSSRK